MEEETVKTRLHLTEPGEGLQAYWTGERRVPGRAGLLGRSIGGHTSLIVEPKSKDGEAHDWLHVDLSEAGWRAIINSNTIQSSFAPQVESR